jgi:hypothetical protein
VNGMAKRSQRQIILGAPFEKREGQMNETLLKQLRQFDLECGIEDGGMVDYLVKRPDGTSYVLRFRVGVYVK